MMSCGRGSVLDAERAVLVLLYAQVALGLWSLCTSWSVWRAALHEQRVSCAATGDGETFPVLICCAGSAARMECGRHVCSVVRGWRCRRSFVRALVEVGVVVACVHTTRGRVEGRAGVASGCWCCTECSLARDGRACGAAATIRRNAGCPCVVRIPVAPFSRGSRGVGCAIVLLRKLSLWFARRQHQVGQRLAPHPL